MIEFTVILSNCAIKVITPYVSLKRECKLYLVSENIVPNIKITINEEDIACEVAMHKSQFEGELSKKDISRLAYLALCRKVSIALIDFDTLLIHGSAISVDGKAYVFVAPSTTGKSTHTRLWREHFGNHSLMINDDKPLIKIENDIVYACGSPWAGKSRLHNNVMVPLVGICYLERGDDNSIQKLSLEEAYSYVLAQTFRPENEVSYIKTLDLIDKLLMHVPFYKMQLNNYKEDAVTTSYEAMKPTTDGQSIYEYINSGNVLFKTVVGISMEPLLHNRESVVKFEKAEGKMKLNDVVLFMRSNGQYVLHRIVKVRNKDYLICGDNQWLYECVPHDMVIGVMTEYSPNGKDYYSVDDDVYKDYVNKYCRHYWMKYYFNYFKSVVGSIIRKLKR